MHFFWYKGATFWLSSTLNTEVIRVESLDLWSPFHRSPRMAPLSCKLKKCLSQLHSTPKKSICLVFATDLVQWAPILASTFGSLRPTFWVLIRNQSVYFLLELDEVYLLIWQFGYRDWNRIYVVWKIAFFSFWFVELNVIIFHETQRSVLYPIH